MINENSLIVPTSFDLVGFRASHALLPSLSSCQSLITFSFCTCWGHRNYTAKWLAKVAWDGSYLSRYHERRQFLTLIFLRPSVQLTEVSRSRLHFDDSSFDLTTWFHRARTKHESTQVINEYFTWSKMSFERSNRSGVQMFKRSSSTWCVCLRRRPVNFATNMIKSSLRIRVSVLCR
jgi:hypothetical protein